MKIALINGSPKVKNSASEFILTSVKSLLPADSVLKEFKFNRPILNEIDLEKIAGTDVLIFAFPLYVDGIPSHLLRCLDQMETYFNTMETKKLEYMHLRVIEKTLLLQSDTMTHNGHCDSLMQNPQTSF